MFKEPFGSLASPLYASTNRENDPKIELICQVTENTPFMPVINALLKEINLDSIPHSNKHWRTITVLILKKLHALSVQGKKDFSADDFDGTIKQVLKDYQGNESYQSHPLLTYLRNETFDNIKARLLINASGTVKKLLVNLKLTTFSEIEQYLRLNTFPFAKLPQALKSTIISYMQFPTFFAATSQENATLVRQTLEKERIRLVNALDISSTKLISGSRNFFVIVGGELYAGGRNNLGQLGVGDKLNRYRLTRVLGINAKITQVIAKETFSLILTEQGELYGCGDNQFDSLGLGQEGIFLEPMQITGFTGKVVQVAADLNTTVIITDKGTLYACGDKLSPKLIPLTGFDGKATQATTDNDHIFIVTNEGKLYRYSYNKDQLLKLEEIRGYTGKVVDVIANQASLFVVTDQGQLYASGNNKCGQLGLGDCRERENLTLVESLEGKVTQVIKRGHSVFVTTTTGLYACGENLSGELGVGDKSPRSQFTKITGFDGKPTQIINNIHSTFIITDEGKLYACGGNYCGKLGVGSEREQLQLTPTLGLNGKVIQVATDGQTTLAMTNEGTLYITGKDLEAGSYVAQEIGIKFTPIFAPPIKLQPLKKLTASLKHLNQCLLNADHNLKRTSNGNTPFAPIINALLKDIRSNSIPYSDKSLKAITVLVLKQLQALSVQGKEDFSNDDFERAILQVLADYQASTSYQSNKFLSTGLNHATMESIKSQIATHGDDAVKKLLFDLRMTPVYIR